jgi:hypothetical protein
MTRDWSQSWPTEQKEGRRKEEELPHNQKQPLQEKERRGEERRGAGAGIGKRVANEDSDAKKKPARVWQEQLS